MIPPRDTSTDDHVGDLLPALINGTLDSSTAMAVRGHLDLCAACRDELAEWEVIASATRTFAARQQATAPALGDLWPEIEPNTRHESGNGTLSHPVQARAAVRQGTADSSRRDRARQSWKTPMSTTTIPTTRPRFSPPAWTRHLHGVSTGLLIAVIAALAVAAWGLNGFGRDGGGDAPNGNFAAVLGSPVAATPSEGCTVESMTRDELIAHFQAANVATEPEHELYDSPTAPSHEEANAIVRTYREWRTCGLFGGGPAYAMRFQSPWFTANTSGLFLDPSLSSTHRPIDEEDIEAFVDILLEKTIPTPDAGEQTEIQPYPTVSASQSAATTGSGDAQVRNLPWYPTPAISPDSTPTVPAHRGTWHPEVFADDIVLTGPDTASVTARYIDDRTGEEMSVPPITYTFVKADGRWLLDSYTDEAR